MGGGGHDYSKDEGTRFFCYYNGQRYYMACHRFFEADKYDTESSKLIFHTNPRYLGENFFCEYFAKKRFCIYYKDNTDGMKNWMLFIVKQQKGNYFTPVFNKNKCSMFILENAGKNYFYIKETLYNVYLYLNSYKKRTDSSFYAGATLERNKATKFQFNDI